MKKILMFIAAVAMMTACSSVDCPVQNIVETVYHAYKADGSRDTLSKTLSIYTARANRTDSMLLNRKQMATAFNLPISYTAPADTLIFHFEDGDAIYRYNTDTVIIEKTNEPQFESIDCHIAYFHNITGVRCTNYHIDSIVVNKPSVNYDSSTEHFHIYFKHDQ